MTLNQSALPVRTKVGDTWQDLDATLVRNVDGTWSPKVAQTSLRISGGGNSPMAVLGDSKLGTTIGAPMTLPEPIVAGPTATYANVLPGVDLQVTARTVGGFSEVFVVHDATAATNPALSKLALPMAPTGMTIATDKAGNVTGKDRLGRTILSAPAPTMWDSTEPAKPGRASLDGIDRDPAGQPIRSTLRGPGAGAKVAKLGAAIRSGRLELTPDQSLLSGAATKYPVFIDPTATWTPVAGGFSGWATISKNFAGTNYWKNTPDPDGHMQVGYSGEITARTLMNFSVPTSVLSGATINSALLKVTQIYAYSCTASKVNLFAPANNTLTSSNATWNAWSGVSLGTAVDSATTNYGYNSSCPATAIPFDVKSTITADVKAGKKLQTFALVASSETDTGGWKKFLETSPTLAITYNHKPNTPSGLKTSQSNDCASAALVSQGSISLYATVADPDGGTVGASFKVWKDGTNTMLVDPAKTSPLDVTSGSTTVVRLNADDLTNNTPAGGTQKFNWAVQASDGLSTSDWATCSFVYDTTRAGHPDIEQVAAGTAQIGQSISIAVTPPKDGASAPTEYLYQLNAGPYGTIDATTATQIVVTPTRFTNTLTVTSRGASGNIGSSSSMTFNAKPANTAIDGDLNGDNLTDLVTVGGKNSVAAGVWLAQGKGDGRISVTATNVGAHGNGVTSPGQSGSPTSFNGAQAITGHFAGTGLQDVLVYYPGDSTPGEITGGAVILNGSGDGSAFQTQRDGTFTNIASGSFTTTDWNDFQDIKNPKQVVNAGLFSGSYPSLLGIASKPDATSFLTYYPTTAVGGYGEVNMLSNKTPADGTDWSTWTLASAQTATGTALFLWQASTGKLYLWNNIKYNKETGALDSFTSYQLSTTFNTGANISLSAADINGDTIPDLWTVGDGAAATAWLVTNLTDTAGTITAKPNQKVLTGTHAWMLNDYVAPGAGSGDTTTKVVWNVDADRPAKDSITNATGLQAVATQKATWNNGDLFEPDVAFDGGSLATTSSAINTNGDFTVDVWAKPTALGGVVLSQDGTNTTAFKLWSDTATASWRFGLTSKDDTTATWAVATAPNNSVKLGVWTHLTATFTKGTGVLDLHVNGKDVATANQPYPWASTKAFRIGATREGTSPSGFFTGQIAEVITFNQVVVPDEGNPAIRDFSGDNRTDVFTRASDGGLRLYRGNGGGGFTSGYSAIGSGWNNYTIVVTGDFNRDGNVDLLGRNTAGELYLYRGNGTNAWQNGGSPDKMGVGFNSYNMIVAGDFNRDGNTDIVARNSAGELYLYRGNGNKYWQNGGSPDKIATGFNTYNHLFTGDFNHDGNTDIVGRNAAGELYLYRSTGNKTWQNGTNPDKVGTSGFNNYTAIFSPQDFDGDGLDDMIVRKGDTGELYLFRGNGANGWLNPSRPNYIGTSIFNSYTMIF
ncbi:FG-GAP-like repeat-containing protein [Actinoplanes sp. NPDC020271]|uniref:FG-GAP-like repeat-containing protein n=1 Tax=Actinoplanes sp. NPDC020271 TaxID=3363896 RepID=UPI0037A7CD86